MSVNNVVLSDTSQQTHTRLNAVLTLAGSDSSGGAGIEADLKTFSAHKVYGLTCITALTAQNTTGVFSVAPTPKETIRKILEANFSDFLDVEEPSLKAIKTGMLTQLAVEVFSEYTKKVVDKGVKIILDPVMISTSGSQLFDEKGMQLCIEKVVKHAHLITPNLEEALVLQRISGGDPRTIDSLGIQDILDITVDLHERLGCENVLVKGGHLPFDRKENAPFQPGGDVKNKVIRDVLYESKHKKLTIFELQAIDSQNTHGTGCTLASAIAANIAGGASLQNSVAMSINYVHQGLVNMPEKLGLGNGPLNHLISPVKQIEKVIESSSDDTVELGSAYEYFTTHPDITNSWKKYTKHRFVELVAQNQLPFERFLYFLKQDYYYLVNYAQVHALAAAVAPSYHQTHSEAVIIGEVVNEIEAHKKRLSSKYNINYERDIDLDIELSPGKACLEYCEYLTELGKREDFTGIKVALAPCLHGYYEAGKYGLEIKHKFDGLLNGLSSEDAEVYNQWVHEYTSDWYTKAHEVGKECLDELFRGKVSRSRLEELVGIFRHVTELEIRFWDEVLERE